MISLDEVIYRFFFPSVFISGLVYKLFALFEKNPDENSSSALISAVTLIVSGILQIALCFFILECLVVKYIVF